MFKLTDQHIGHVKVGRSYNLSFSYEDIEITKMTSPCDCSDIADDKVNKQVLITYRPKPIPDQVLEQGRTSYAVHKLFTITGINPQGLEVIIQLSFTAVVNE